MPYPMAPMPTLREFVAKARALGLKEGTSTGVASGPRGEERFRYLKRDDGVFAILPKMDEEERLTPILLSNLCRQLGVNPSEFDLRLGFLQDPFSS
jgi:hypothetical protein